MPLKKNGYKKVSFVSIKSGYKTRKTIKSNFGRKTFSGTITIDSTPGRRVLDVDYYTELNEFGYSSFYV